MVSIVGKINSVGFKSKTSVTQADINRTDIPQIKELPKVTPDFAVRTPQSYTKLGINKLPNGVEVHTYKLANGHKVSIIPMEDSPTTVKNYVNVGSMNETDEIKGISHFLEHMAFNGTVGSEGYIKLKRGDSFGKIDEIGGWTNASTSHFVTDYINSTPMLEEKDLEQQLDVISAMAEDLALTDEMIEKEKSPVCSEIDMILDDPYTVATDQTVRSLYNIKSSADELVAGSVSHIKNLDRTKVLDYYNTYYTPDNMHLVISGNIDPQKTIELVSKKFHSNKKPSGIKFEERLEPIENSVRKDFISDKATSAHIVIGFEGEKNNDVKSAVISEIANKYLRSPELGLANKIDDLHGFIYLSQDRISNNPNNPKLNSLMLECSEENSEKSLKIVFDKLSNIKAPSEKSLNNIKQKLLMDYYDVLEESLSLNNFIGQSAFMGDDEYIYNYENILKEITPEDVLNYFDKHLNLNKAAITVIHPNTDKETVIENHKKAQNITFNGKTKQPVNTEKISEQVLDNNYMTAFVETKNNNIPFFIELYYKLPEGTNPAAGMVLDSIMQRGTQRLSNDEFQQYCDDNNIRLFSGCSKTRTIYHCYTDKEHFTQAAKLTNELINNPRITEEEVQRAVEEILDLYEREQDTASNLYNEYDAKINPLKHTKSEIIEKLKNLTVDDVKKLHKYIMENAKGGIIINIPENNKEIKETAIKEFSKFNKVKSSISNYYRKNEKPVVITKAKNVSQADIEQVYKYMTTNTIKENIIANLANEILSSSKSVGLFDSLRERDHLAYSVHSSVNNVGNCGELSLKILTSTDNKDTGISTYDNVEKSIRGFHRQIGMLLDSKYTDEELEAAKKKLKAVLLDNETVYNKMHTANSAQSSDLGMDKDNVRYQMIDSITREDIDKFTHKVFKDPPVYAIVASQDTLDYNKNFFNELECV